MQIGSRPAFPTGLVQVDLQRMVEKSKTFSAPITIRKSAFSQLDRGVVALIGLQGSEPLLACKRHRKQDALRHRRLDMNAASSPARGYRFRYDGPMLREILDVQHSSRLAHGGDDFFGVIPFVEGGPAANADILQQRCKCWLAKDVPGRRIEHGPI